MAHFNEPLHTRTPRGQEDNTVLCFGPRDCAADIEVRMVSNDSRLGGHFDTAMPVPSYTFEA